MSLHESRAAALDSVRTNAFRIRRSGETRSNGGHVNPFYLEGRMAFLSGLPYQRNESDPWRAGWSAAQLESKA
jgi:hypothetical protein